jgi:hypothetical protein
MPAKLERRLRKLEALRYDYTGLVPHSDEWYAYHLNQLDRVMEGDPIATHPPLSFIDAMLERAEREGLV